MKGQKKGWMIIGFDLIIVLFVYFLYANFGMAPESSQIESRVEGITYTLTVQSIKKGKIPLKFSIHSRRHSKVTVELPRGITLMISEGQQAPYWRKTLNVPKKLQLQSGQTQSWSLKAPLPESVGNRLYAGFLIDKERQKLVEIPGSSDYVK